MELSIEKLIVEIKENTESIGTWVVVNHGLSMWRPDYYADFLKSNDSRLKGRGDIHFDGVEFATDKNGGLVEFGFITDTSSMKAVSITWPNTASVGICCITNIKGTQMVNLDDNPRNEDTLEYDKDNQIISWYCINKRPERFVLIATNVAVGLRGNEFTGLLAKLQ